MLLGILLAGSFSCAQDEPGRSIGKVSTKGNLIVLELDDDTLGASNLFDLQNRTLRFMPAGSRYRVQTSALQWDSDFGTALDGAEVTLHNFAFPFSGKQWNSFRVGLTGSIRFGTAEKDTALDPYGHPDSGVILQRFDQLSNASETLRDRAPAICVFLKPRLYGARYVKELPDRVLITWDLTEPFGGLLDFSWFRTVNQFQAVLYRSGRIEFSYKQLNARDAIIGLYPVMSAGEKLASVHFSSLTRDGGTYTAVYESFHYRASPRPQDLSCTVIQTLGDRFDLLAYYSDFRVDSQEASPPSDGPIGGGVTGIGDTQHEQTPEILRSRCTQGRFQMGYGSPVWVGANEMQAAPPQGAPAGGPHDLAFYNETLAEGSADRKPIPYNYAVGHLGHEFGHRWSAYARAKLGGKITPLGPWPHWDRGLETRVAYPYSLPIEASTLGGGAWQDNYDGTYTQLRDGYFVPASGYSYLDLYLMGFISAAEVPDFFLLTNLVPAGKDTNARAIFRADRTKLTIQDVIAAEGQRSPDVNHSQRQFNTGIVVVVEHGKTPTTELLERAEGIRQGWVNYWATATGHRAAMTTNQR